MCKKLHTYQTQMATISFYAIWCNLKWNIGQKVFIWFSRHSLKINSFNWKWMKTNEKLNCTQISPHV